MLQKSHVNLDVGTAHCSSMIWSSVAASKEPRQFRRGNKPLLHKENIMFKLQKSHVNLDVGTCEAKGTRR